MKQSKAVIAGAAVAGLLTGSMAVRAYALNTSSRPTARARAVASILVITRAKEREAAQPTEASRSSDQTLAAHIGGCLGRFREGGTASVLSQ
jgi:hypothetical protein